jgi:hypothetical protein
MVIAHQPGGLFESGHIRHNGRTRHQPLLDAGKDRPVDSTAHAEIIGVYDHQGQSHNDGLAFEAGVNKYTCIINIKITSYYGNYY